MLRNILKFGESPLFDELTHTVDVLDRVHRWPQIPACPVVVSGSCKEDGCYNSLSHPSRPKKLEISRFAVYPSITLIHEIGHMLDHMALNPIKRGFGSDHDPLFDPLHSVWETSRSIRKLIALSTRKRPVVAPMVRKFLIYMLQPRELWARTYVQWVAHRSQDVLIVSQLRSSTVEPSGEPPVFRRLGIEYYLGDDDFRRIIPLVDDLFRQRGLL
ncbi:MAG: hypothetical protein FWD53_02655 [Phycisphaerales bacterium]|nr:hypothetical protein [Phycisphaerales bacterium]